MKIRKIQSIKNYKSFSDFSWDKFCKDCSNNEQVLSNYSVIFGENGSGKSSICDILKSLSQIQDFPNSAPDLAEIEIKNGSNQIYKFENGSWTPNQLNKNSFLFFDEIDIKATIYKIPVKNNRFVKRVVQGKPDEHGNYKGSRLSGFMGWKPPTTPDSVTQDAGSGKPAAPK